MTIGIELDDHVRALIHNPDVILRIHTDRMGKNEPIQTLADLTDILPRLIELKETRRGTYEDPIGSQGRIDGASPGINVNMPLGVGGHAHRLA